MGIRAGSEIKVKFFYCGAVIAASKAAGAKPIYQYLLYMDTLK